MNEAKFKAQNVMANLLGELSERSRDVIVSRFGIGKDKYETLEAIGQRYGITRERVRQIEADALRHIKDQKRDAVIQPISSALERFINLKGGVVDEETLTTEFASSFFNDAEGGSRGLTGLILAVDGRFKRSPVTDEFATRWYVDAPALKNQERVLNQLASNLKSSGKVVDETQLLKMAGTDSVGESVVRNYLAASKVISKNVYGQWGLADWAEIRPRGVKDKAYLVMKKEGKPLHFREVAGLINKSEFSSRSALAQTVHNELIKDKRFVLVGRGLYALNEWGFREGTVKDVISRVLKEKGPLAKNELLKAVLAERFVKPSTVILNLNAFKKTSDNRYTLA